LINDDISLLNECDEHLDQLTTSQSLAPLSGLLEELPLTSALSAREREVVAAAVRGLDTKVTAAELGVSPKTIDELWRRIYRKFRCNSRVAVLSRLLASCFRRLAGARTGPSP
jgi:DNA-binding CsgD family transcriptional regulator